MIIPVILSGGAGSRLWPISTKICPKQLLPLLSKRSLLQETVCRVSKLPNTLNPLLVCNQQHGFKVIEQLQQVGIKPSAIILEPIGKNTAPAIAIAALQAINDNEDSILLVLPSDHVIGNIEVFHKTIEIAKQYADVGKLVTFGIVPTHPETGYGYIKTEALGDDAYAYNIAAFVEKPDLKSAQKYINAGNYYWNSGMFMFRASKLLKEIEQHAPDILQVCKDVYATHVIDKDFIHLDKITFEKCPSISIDYAVMEKTSDAIMVPLDADWSDIGSWLSLWKYGQKDINDNIILGDVVAKDVCGSYIRATSRKIVAVGIKDHIIVETNAGILVVHKNDCQKIKELNYE
jgi:mannose-1-phosphate guanylyltransferase/mannose-6-phosphate isomerase